MATGRRSAPSRLQPAIEVVCVALVLALVAAWRFTPPPRALILAAVQPVRVHIHTGRAMADLQIDPADADGRRVAITLLDGEFRPLAAKEVTVVFARPDSGIEPLRFAATHVAATIWQIDGVRLPVAGPLECKSRNPDQRFRENLY